LFKIVYFNNFYLNVGVLNIISMINIYIFQKYLSCCSINDHAVDTPQGFNKKDSVAIKTKSGNQLINHEK